MLKLEEIKNQILKNQTESSEVNSKLIEEEKKQETQLDELKKEYSLKQKKIKDSFSSKIQNLQNKKETIEKNKKNLGGEIFMKFADKTITQEELDELTKMIKG